MNNSPISPARRSSETHTDTFMAMMKSSPLKEKEESMSDEEYAPDTLKINIHEVSSDDEPSVRQKHKTPLRMNESKL